MINVEIQKNGTLAPCCRYHAPDKKDRWHFRRFEQWWREDLQELRDALSSGQQPPGCKACWRDERAGVRSYRQTINGMHRQYKNLPLPLDWPKMQMYNFGTHCNLRCIMCSPQSSSSLETEYLQNQAVFNGIGIQWPAVDNELKWYRKVEFIELRRSLLERATFLAFQGGEPLLSPDVLTMLDNHPQPHKVDISITTNLTTLTDGMLDLFHRFRHMDLVISLEGVGSHNDYLRHGSNWSKLEANIKRVIGQGFSLRIHHTFQRTSLYALPALIEFAQLIDIPVISNILDSPPYLSIRSSNHHERTGFVEAIDSLPHMDSNLKSMRDFVLACDYDAALDQKFWRYIEVIDQIRGTSFRDVFAMPSGVDKGPTD